MNAITDDSTLSKRQSSPIFEGQTDQIQGAPKPLQNFPFVKLLKNTYMPWKEGGKTLKDFGTILFLPQNRRLVMGVTLLTTCNMCIRFAIPYFLGESITKEDRTSLVALVSLYWFATVVQHVQDKLMEKWASHIWRHILHASTSHILNKSLYYHAKTEVGDMFYFLQKNAAVVQIALPLFKNIIPTLVEGGLACIFLSQRYGKEVSASIVTLIALYAIYGSTTASPILKAREEHLQAGNVTWNTLEGNLKRYKVVHDCCQFDQVMQTTDTRIETMMQKSYSAFLLESHAKWTHNFLAHMHMGSVMAYAAYHGQSLPELLVLFGYLREVSSTLPDFAAAVNNCIAAYPDLRFVLSELAKPAEVVDLHPDVPLRATEGRISFQKVQFQHPESPSANKSFRFNDLSFDIEPGEKVALVSTSGQGKTTLFNLLYGYFRPSSGHIVIDSQDIHTVSLKSVRQAISLLDQNHTLFKGSVRENILYGTTAPQKVSDEQILDVAHTVHLKDFLLAKGLDSDVGEDGKQLSSGEQQKIALLRGLVKPHSIRLLDEVTASLDNESATPILEGLLKNAPGITTLMITHKLTEAQKADRVIVIDEGRVIDSGIHADLLERCPIYQKLWQKAIT